MVTRSVVFAEGEYYHLYNRGVDKRTIFQNHSDYERFRELLYLSNSKDLINVRDIKGSQQDIYSYLRTDPQVAIGAYCLMPNHFHILLTPLVPGGVSKFMNKISTSYSMYFNKRYDRSGRLFEGSFKARQAGNDVYLKYLFSYIHLNPVKLLQSDWKENGIRDGLEAWHFATGYNYSSLADYLGSDRNESRILDSALFPHYFRNQSDLKSELLEWITFDPG